MLILAVGNSLLIPYSTPRVARGKKEGLEGKKPLRERERWYEIYPKPYVSLLTTVMGMECRKRGLNNREKNSRERKKITLGTR